MFMRPGSVNILLIKIDRFLKFLTTCYIDRLLNHTLLEMQKALEDSKLQSNETDKIVQEGLQEIEEKNLTITSYSQEAMQLKEENNQHLISLGTPFLSPSTLVQIK